MRNRENKADNTGKSAVEQIIRAMDTEQFKKNHMILAIDGRCAAGKTTLAAHLQSRMECNVFHMDDFFPPEKKRTRTRLEEPGGNVEYERFLKEIMLPLSNGQDITYRPYSCRTGTFLEPVAVGHKQVNLVEGAYSCHPELWGYYDLRIFVSVDKDEQMRRIHIRNGAARAEVFANRWIPLEETYFASLEIEKNCDFCFDSTAWKERMKE